jgi:hypothetical protein
VAGGAAVTAANGIPANPNAVARRKAAEATAVDAEAGERGWSDWGGWRGSGKQGFKVRFAGGQ